MLIEEVRAVTGMTYPEITHALFVEGYPKNPNGKEVDRDRAEEYTLPLSHPRSRTPGFDELQLLENDVAYVLERPAHTLVITDRNIPDNAEDPAMQFISVPRKGIDWRRERRRRKVDPDSLEVAYAADWPTYGALVEVGLAELFKWQYGYLWKRGHFARSMYAIPDQCDIDTWLQQRVDRLELVFNGLTHLMLADHRQQNFPAEIFDMLWAIPTSPDELCLYLRTFGPRGVHRWRHLAESFLEKRISAGILPEIWGKNGQSQATTGKEIPRRFKQLAVI